jgi:hypothetical protein
MRVSMTDSKKRLAVVWFIGGGTLFLLLLAQTMFGRYGDKVKEAWAWLLPTILPTLSLITSGIVISGPMGKSLETKTVDRFAFRLSLMLSIFYLVTVSLTFLLSPFSPVPPLELMKLSNLWLAPFQGLVSAALAAFFVSTK